MITAVIILGACLAMSLAFNAYVLWLHRDERRELTDRVMSLSSPISLTTFKANQGSTTSDVNYMDEAREFQLSPPPDPYEAS